MFSKLGKMIVISTLFRRFLRNVKVHDGSTSVNHPTRKRHAENTAQKKSFQNKLKGSEIIEIKKLEQQR